jgi:uncharacterized protein YndB with AHSA1/START domain
MSKSNSINGSIEIKTDPYRLWDVVTNPDKIKLYTGSDTITDWKVGSPILWEGQHGDFKYQNKGKVLENNPGYLLKFLYWSGLGGDSDTIENYSVITYQLEKLHAGKMKFTYTRENIPTEVEKKMFDEHLPYMLEEIKRLAEV